MITGSMILSKLGINNLENDDLIKSTYGKVLEISNFYHSMFAVLFFNLNEHNDLDKFNFINERIMHFQNTMSEQNYTNFLHNAELNLSDDPSIEQHIVDL
uniref:Uncharacterized protein n=1 Tax=Meloidogyne enterolobii TaxID=390850 RepID=A0A6V7WTU4_MELEN|nr:unnamed protein product [Meloidogyne enterolobii]